MRCVADPRSRARIQRGGTGPFCPRTKNFTVGSANSITLTIMHNVVMKRCYAFGGAQMAKQIIVDQVDSMETTLARLFPEMTANITVAFLR